LIRFWSGKEEQTPSGVVGPDPFHWLVFQGVLEGGGKEQMMSCIKLIGVDLKSALNCFCLPCAIGILLIFGFEAQSSMEIP
jgi:hypothetical protein